MAVGAGGGDMLRCLCVAGIGFGGMSGPALVRDWLCCVDVLGSFARGSTGDKAVGFPAGAIASGSAPRCIGLSTGAGAGGCGGADDGAGDGGGDITGGLITGGVVVAVEALPGGAFQGISLCLVPGAPLSSSSVVGYPRSWFAVGGGCSHFWSGWWSPHTCSGGVDLPRVPPELCAPLPLPLSLAS